MHMADRNYTIHTVPVHSKPYNTLSLSILGGVGGRSKYNVFPHHLETPQAIYKAENSMTLKIHLECVRICVS